jgi:hypothetical protein
MKIYIRKLNSRQCTNKSISVTMPIFKDFFEDSDVIYVKGKKSGQQGKAPFTFTRDREDPRFGGVFKEVLRAEGNGSFKIGDILVVEKSSPNYIVSLITEEDPEYETYNTLLQNGFHSEISADTDVTDDSPTENSLDNVFIHNVYGMHMKKQNDALSEDDPHICIGWSKMGDLTDVSSKNDVSAKYSSIWPKAKNRTKGQDVGQIYRFVLEANVGDYVVFGDGKIAHIGVITSDYYYQESPQNQDNDYVNNRKVEWKKDIPYSELSTQFKNSLGSAMSFFKLNDYKSVVYDLLNGTYERDLFENGDELLISNIDVSENLNVKQLVEILNEIYSLADEGSRSNAIRMFGFKYAESIMASGVSPQKLIDDSIIDSNSYGGEITKAINMYNSIKNNEYGVHFVDTSNTQTNIFDYNTTKGSSECKILFGIPGCGKSYHIDYKILGKDKDTKEYCGNYKKENIIRTTFFQDYSNTDFIGQILPKVTKNENGDSVVEYSFNPGPFTLALIQAIKNPTKKVALVIEEINRGNAPAIFGDIFQLLDRDDGSISQYGIINVGIIDYLNSLNFDVDGENVNYIFNEIKIPGNMDIFATMNTSDQNVYTLDTAFTRRWAKERIPNDFGDNEEIKNKAVPGMNEYTWSEFVESINSYIDDHLDDLQINEDKKIGAFFVGLTTLDNVDEFAYKVLDYLWSDVSKLDHNVVFNNYKTFESLIKDYKSKGVKVFRPNIFEEKVAAHPQEEEENE